METNIIIWNPEEVGPFDRCIRCFTKVNDDFAFCLNCGQKGLVFDNSLESEEIKCHNHYDKNAIAYCCLCKKPICEKCNVKEHQHHSLAAGWTEFFYCKRMLEKIVGYCISP